jgi:3'(2'), 5'-bisphosphate nucleotidase
VQQLLFEGIGEDVIEIEFLSDLAHEAGRAILEVYGTDFDVERKGDRSPLTLADKRSHEIISRGLLSRYPEIPVVSEEGKEIAYAVRKDWSRFWLVDPLDGTKEFVKKNGEFTVNIALVQGNRPVLGIIYVPVQGRLIVGDVERGCREISEAGRRQLHVSDPLGHEGTIRVIKSRSHPSPNLEAILALLPAFDVLGRGSALKFCVIAAGEADFYPRLGPTWEWDTAAGQAIVEAAGGVMLDFSGVPFDYNKTSLINGPFLVACNLDWLKQTGILEKAASLDLS